jgi:adenosylcobinamide kinase/adenosylcobinamide-phosphate guanylyltransferase
MTDGFQTTWQYDIGEADSKAGVHVQNLTLITGGVRSGKSIFAERLAKQSNKTVHYIATMPVLDDDEEQQQRIHRHRSRRPEGWQTIEAPYTLPAAIAKLRSASGFCLIDCLSVYVSNIILGDTPDLGPAKPYEMESRLFGEIDRILEEIVECPNLEFVIVTNEVGWGVVPDNQLARAFRDFLGIANQMIAQQAQEVWMTVAGIPTKIK